MAIVLDESQRQFLLDKNFAHLATINADGSPQVSPVWVDYDGTHIIVNSEQSRLKVRNMKRDPRVALSISDQTNPYRYIEIRGKVVELTAEGGFESIDALCRKYTGREKYPWNKPTDVRLQIKIAPEKVGGMRRS